MEPKFCINCKHIGRNGGGDPLKYKCFAPQNIKRQATDYVTGETVTLYNASTCYEAREGGWCSAAGTWFEEAPPKFIEPARFTESARTKNSDVTDLLSQLTSMK